MFEKEAEEYALANRSMCVEGDNADLLKDVFLDVAEPREKRIAELEEKISILLSCKNCPENKGGLLCQQEYEDKCLAQKIQFIKELQEENAELKKLKRECETSLCRAEYQYNYEQLTKAKEIIKIFLKYEICTLNIKEELADNITKAKAFLKSEVEK